MEQALRKEVVGGEVRRILWFGRQSNIPNTTTRLFFNAVVLIVLLLNFWWSERTILEWLIGEVESLHGIGIILDALMIVICGFNFYDVASSFIANFWFYLTSSRVPLTPSQKKLWGISEDDIRFQTTPTTSPTAAKRISSPSPSFSNLSWLFHVTPKQRSPGSPAIGMAIASPYFLLSMASSPEYRERSYSSPFKTVRFSPDVYGYQTVPDIGELDYGQTPERLRRRIIPISPTMDIEQSSPRGILRKPKEFMEFQDAISDQAAESDVWRSPGNISRALSSESYGIQSIASTYDVTSPSKSFDLSELTSRPYQTAQISAPEVIQESSMDLSMTGTKRTSPVVSKGDRDVDSIWIRYGISKSETLEEQRLRLRLWLSATILKPLIDEIDNLNSKAMKTLASVRSPDFIIGESSLFHLQSIVASKLELYPTLGALLPYLELSSNQGYLVQRLRELGERDSCLKEFRWNSGGQYKNKPWDDRLPNDSELIIHLFSTYMDSKLPLHPQCPEGKSFSSRYVIQHPEKPPASRKRGTLIIHQNLVSPPNFQILIDDLETVEFEKGKNNLFSALLLFFHYLKFGYNGRLDTLSLGESGLNVLWILE